MFVIEGFTKRKYREEGDRERGFQCRVEESKKEKRIGVGNCRRKKRERKCERRLGREDFVRNLETEV